MKTIMGTLRASIGLLILTLTVTPTPAQKSGSPDYWPMKKGNSWTLLMKVGKDTTVNLVATVTKVTPGKNGKIATLDYVSNGKSVQTETYQITPQAIARLSSLQGGAGKIEPGFPVIKYPMKSGAKWTWKGTYAMGQMNGDGEATLTVSGPETVQTPAGKFKAFKVSSALLIKAQGQQVSIPNAYWFAPGVGLVKQTIQLGPQMVEGSLTKYKVQ